MVTVREDPDWPAPIFVGLAGGKRWPSCLFLYPSTSTQAVNFDMLILSVCTVL